MHAAGHAKHLLVTAVGMQLRRENARLLACGDNHRASTIAEQNTGTAIAPVENARVHLCTRHQHMFGLTGTDEQIGDRKCVDKTTADGLHVKSRTARNPELRLQNARRAGEDHVRRCRGNDNEIDVRGRDSCRLQSSLRRSQCQIACHLSFSGNVPATNASAGSYPFIGSVDHARQIVVGHDFFGQIASSAGYAREHHAAFR